MLAGFQLSARMIAYAWTVGVGVTKIISVSAPGAAQPDQLRLRRAAAEHVERLLARRSGSAPWRVPSADLKPAR